VDCRRFFDKGQFIAGAKAVVVTGRGVLDYFAQQGDGICAKSLSSPGLMLGAPLGARPAHVVQFWSIGVEQSVCEGTEQAARAAAVDEAGDIRFIHGQVLLSYLLSSRSQEPRFCLSAPNICLLQPKREQRRFEAIQTRLINLFQLRPRLPGVPALLKLRLGLF
jgi:hypothetical protein